MSDVCNIALLGQKFMGRAHSNAFLKAPRFFKLPLKPVMHTIVGRDLIALAPFADRWGWRNYSTSWKEVVKSSVVNLVDITTPNYMHAEQALAALSAGKHVAVEKPLAGTLKDARAMRNAAVRSKRCKTFVWFNYRRCPAMALAYRLMREGRLGRIFHVRANFLQSWAGPTVPLSWRFQKKFAGTGAHGDLNAHLIDLARFITGQEIVEVTGAVSETFVVERPLPNVPGKAGPDTLQRKPLKGKSDVDDAAFLLVRFTGGTIGTFEATRVALGHQNTLFLELNGENGAIRFNLENMNELWLFDKHEDRRLSGWRKITCTTAGDHPYAAAWWQEGHLLGYEHTYVNMVADMMAVISGEDPIVPLPDFADAYETQRVLEAATLAAKHRAAVKMSEIK